MTGGEAAEVTKERVAHHLVFGQSHDLAGRDRHAVQAKALGVDAELAEGRVFLAEAEVFARLRRVLADAKFQCRLLGTRQRTRELAGAAQQRADFICEVGVGRTDVENRRDLDPDFAACSIVADSWVLRGEPIVDPGAEAREVVGQPWAVARHGAVGETLVDQFGVGAYLVVDDKSKREDIEPASRSLNSGRMSRANPKS
jgi:hypothetical protein